MGNVPSGGSGCQNVTQVAAGRRTLTGVRTRNNNMKKDLQKNSTAPTFEGTQHENILAESVFHFHSATQFLSDLAHKTSAALPPYFLSHVSVPTSSH